MLESTIALFFFAQIFFPPLSFSKKEIYKVAIDSFEMEKELFLVVDWRWKFYPKNTQSLVKWKYWNMVLDDGYSISSIKPSILMLKCQDKIMMEEVEVVVVIWNCDFQKLIQPNTSLPRNCIDPNVSLRKETI